MLQYADSFVTRSIQSDPIASQRRRCCLCVSLSLCLCLCLSVSVCVSLSRATGNIYITYNCLARPASLPLMIVAPIRACYGQQSADPASVSTAKHSSLSILISPRSPVHQTFSQRGNPDGGFSPCPGPSTHAAAPLPYTISPPPPPPMGLCQGFGSHAQTVSSGSRRKTRPAMALSMKMPDHVHTRHTIQNRARGCISLDGHHAPQQQ
ncbi:hypothetical protein BCR44DRAFT_1228339 [Catenaria anguillulae PL171]|uniref:Uncharacterized protein n=1 Tax=Catenaria anguillulae PL171 TaxID=765915 RepID=A0A1Y2HDS9_9FUNG|nr:hypothetical protein BCR44DRAFT_1228339 [Catenaria anguillulae PL171]